MKITILTLFPDMFEPILHSSILGKAIEGNKLEVELINIRDFAKNKHKSVDDYPFGGGAGMVMTPQPIFDCLESIDNYKQALKIYFSPRGQVLNNQSAQSFAKYEHIIMLCGHYEGVDERAIELFDCQVSIGDYILTGGELPAMIFVDCVSRFIPGVLGSEHSAYDESFSNGLLEYPHYTRPQDFRGKVVPEILLSGHHKKIEAWRNEQALKITKEFRPDLLKDETN